MSKRTSATAHHLPMSNPKPQNHPYHPIDTKKPTTLEFQEKRPQPDLTQPFKKRRLQTP